MINKYDVENDVYIYIKRMQRIEQTSVDFVKHERIQVLYPICPFYLCQFESNMANY